jgi:uncharacterized membrane protein YfcA
VDSTALLAVLFFLVALLYASVGQAGASGYLAAMAVVGLAPDVMKPTALLLNVLVASFATVRFHRAGPFSWPTFWPFAAASIPASFVGGALQLPEHLFGPLVGAVLLLAAALLVWRPAGPRSATASAERPVPIVPGLGSGAAIGLLSGLTATGGAIFLSPLLLFTGWGQPRRTAGVAAAFIWVNSVAGLAGNVASMRNVPSQVPLWAAAAGAGGLVGAYLGSRVLPDTVLRRLLGAVLVIAGLKLMLA